MNHALASFCSALFFASVPALLAIRFLRPRFMPWWLLILLAAILSWILLNLSLRFSDAHLAELVEQAGGVEHAPPQMVDDLMNDGGPRSFAFLFGWIGAFVLLAPGLALYAIAHQVRKKSVKGGGLLPNTAYMDSSRK